MTTNASEFPCIEASRCFVTEREMGMRMSIKSVYEETDDSYQYTNAATFTNEQSLKEEWYIHFDVERSDKEGPGNLKRFLQLRHIATSQYLGCDDKGRVTCTSSSSDSTWWLMQPVRKKNSSAPDQNDPSSPTNAFSDELVEDEYILISRKYPLRRLSYSKSLQGSGEDFIPIASKNADTEPSLWTIKFTSGELCFIINPVVHHHIRCNMSGSLSLTSQSSAWEVFRFIEVGNGDLYISSWIHLTKFLGSNSDGQIYTTDMETASVGYAERWRLEDPSKGNGLYIRNVATRRYLSVGRKRDEHLWTTTKPNDYALWHLDAPHLHVYYLTSLLASVQMETGNDSPDETDINPYKFYVKEGFDDVHISSQKEGPSLSTKKEKEEEWKVEVTSDGYFTFFSVSHEKYLGCNSKGDVHTTTSKGGWTLWEKQVSPHGGVTFKSKEHKRFLAVTKTDNTLYTTKDMGTDLCHCWRLDPRVPRNVSQGTRGYFAGAMSWKKPSISMPHAVFGALEAAQSTEVISKHTDVTKEFNAAAQRPVSSWKSWARSDPDSLPSSLNSQSSSWLPTSMTDTTFDNPRKAECEEQSNDSTTTGPREANGEKRSTDKTPKANDKKNSINEEEMGANGEKKSTDKTPKANDKKNSINEEEMGDII